MSPTPVPEQRQLLRPFAAILGAVAFLTRLPAPGARAPGSRSLVAAAPYFPLVGGLLGALVGGSAVLLEGPLAPLLAASLAIGLELALTGALHVDGLADCADGLAGRDRRHRLAIMRDHSLGTYGATALIVDLLVKAAALAVLAERGEVGPVLGAFAVSRAAALPLAVALPYARPGPGTGQALADSLSMPAAAAGIVLAVTLAGIAMGIDVLFALAAFGLIVGLVGAYSHRALGGVTGDVMGAAIELTATLALVVTAWGVTPAS